MTLRLLGRLAAASAMLLALAGCTQRATQLVVVVDSDLPTSGVVRVATSVWALDAEHPTRAGRLPTGEHVFEVAAGEVSLAFSYGVVPPGGSPSSRVEIEVAALDARDVVTVRRVARTGFLAQQTLRLPMYLAASCVGVACDDDQTCDRGSCVAATVPVESLTPIERGDELLDGGTRDAAPADAGSRDAASGAIPSMVDPAWAFGTPYTGSFEGIDVATFDAAGEDALIAWTVAPPAGTPLVLGATSYAGPGIVLARVDRAGTVRWSQQWTIPGGDEFSLQSASVATFEEIGGDLFVCGSVSDEGLSDAASGTTFTSSLRSQGFIARLDPATGALTTVSIARQPDGARDGDVVCRGLLSLSNGALLAVFEYYNLITPEPAGVTFDDVPVTVVGAVPTRARTVLLELRYAGATFTPVTARLASTSSVDVHPRVDGGAWLAVTGSPAASGFLATEPAPPTGTRQSAALVRLDDLGVPMAYHLAAATTENVQQFDVAVGGGNIWLHAGFTDGFTDAVWWAETTGDARVDRGTSELGAGVMLGILARFDETTELFSTRVWVDPVPIFTRGFAADREANLYLGTRLATGSTAFGVTSPHTANGRTDALLASFAPSGALRWRRILTETTGEATYGDEVLEVEVADDGAVLAIGSSSSSGIPLGPGITASGQWVALFAP